MCINFPPEVRILYWGLRKRRRTQVYLFPNARFTSTVISWFCSILQPYEISIFQNSVPFRLQIWLHALHFIRPNYQTQTSMKLPIAIFPSPQNASCKLKNRINSMIHFWANILVVGRKMVTHTFEIYGPDFTRTYFICGLNIERVKTATNELMERFN